MGISRKAKTELYTRYPLLSVFLYNGSTVVHYLLGGIGIIVGYNFSAWLGYLIGGLYLVFSFVEMYIVMPLTVCSSCVYYRLEDSLCISGLNKVSKRFSKERNHSEFVKRAQGPLCFNNLYIAALVLPILFIFPSLIVNFSIQVLIIFILLLALLLFRFFVIFPKIACVHCAAKFRCPQANQMGVRER